MRSADCDAPRRWRHALRGPGPGCSRAAPPRRATTCSISWWRHAWGPRWAASGSPACTTIPASQAALAQLDADDPRTALRFELYAEGVELANGYVELAERRRATRAFRRPIRRNAQRRGLAQPRHATSRLLAALEQGLPRCAGVALGFDRVAMLARARPASMRCMAFPWERA